jgi:site-specific DNA-methyltransferase (adenine-specific)
MKQMQTASIDLTITSPPYDDLRKYEGYSFDFEAIARELFRLTKEGGVVVWIVKDATIDGNETGTSFKQALFFKEIGFKLHDTMIYNKKNVTFPHPNRYHDTFEYMFIFSKGKPKTTNLISDRENKYGGTTTWGDKTQREKDGSLTNKGKRQIAETGVRFNVWTYATGKGHTTKDSYAFEHPAMFPEQLAADHVLSWSNEGDLIFDPFMGSNTTGKMALLNKRSFIGIEISEKYYAISKKRVEEMKYA